MFLGSFSPIHCRFTVALVGTFCIILAVLAGYGFCFLFGWKMTEMTNTIIILILGIGVDDMFVICNAVDQTPLDLPASKRIKLAMRHAGPSITITSLTDCLAFFIGSTSSLLAIKAFCIFTGVTIIMLYFTVITVFLSAVVYDTRRVAANRRDACGLCFCKEDSKICCSGKLLNPKQQIYSKIKEKV